MTRQVVHIYLSVVARLVLVMDVNLTAVDDHVVTDDDRHVVGTFTRNRRQIWVIREPDPMPAGHVVRQQKRWAAGKSGVLRGKPTEHEQRPRLTVVHCAVAGQSTVGRVATARPNPLPRHLMHIRGILINIHARINIRNLISSHVADVRRVHFRHELSIGRPPPKQVQPLPINSSQRMPNNCGGHNALGRRRHQLPAASKNVEKPEFAANSIAIHQSTIEINPPRVKLIHGVALPCRRPRGCPIDWCPLNGGFDAEEEEIVKQLVEGCAAEYVEAVVDGGRGVSSAGFEAAVGGRDELRPPEIGGHRRGGVVKVKGQSAVKASSKRRTHAGGPVFSALAAVASARVWTAQVLARSARVARGAEALATGRRTVAVVAAVVWTRRDGVAGIEARADVVAVAEEIDQHLQPTHTTQSHVRAKRPPVKSEGKAQHLYSATSHALQLLRRFASQA